jgi:hypothetical protein
MAFSTKKYVYDDDKYTDLLLPLRINGRWVLLIVQLGELKLVVMVFEDWDPMEHKAFIEIVAHTMKIEALDIQIRIRGKPLDEKKLMWPVDRVVQFFQKDAMLQGVFPLDRLVAFVYDTMMKGSGTTYVLEQFSKKGRKDGVVIKRLRLIQATILARMHSVREARQFALADRGEKFA